MLAIADGEDEKAEEQLSATLRLLPVHAPSLYQCARLVEKRGALHEAMLMYHTLVTSHERGTCFADAAARLANVLAQASLCVSLRRHVHSNIPSRKPQASPLSAAATPDARRACQTDECF